VKKVGAWRGTGDSTSPGRAAATKGVGEEHVTGKAISDSSGGEGVG
jgi:hypothetical protein